MEGIGWNFFKAGVFTDDVGKRSSHDVINGFPSEVSLMGEEESVAMHEVFELPSLDSVERSSSEATRDWSFSQTSGKQVNVVWVLVDALEQFPIGLADLRWFVVPTINLGSSSEFFIECHIGWQTMITASLNVPGNQITTKVLVGFREKLVGCLHSHMPVIGLSFLCHQSHEDHFHAFAIIKLIVIKVEIVLAEGIG